MGSLADRLIEFSFGGAKMTFDKFLQRGAEIIEHTPVSFPEPSNAKPTAEKAKAESTVPSLGRPPLDPGRARPGAREKYLEKKLLWETTAIGQIISIYEKINNVLFEIGDTIGIDAASPLSVLYTLSNKGVLNKEIVDLYSTLSDARNLVAHARALPNVQETYEYVRQAAYLHDLLVDLKGKLDRGEIDLNK